MDIANGSSSNYLPEVYSSTLTVSISLLESGPMFINMTEQIIFTTYILISLIMACILNGFVAGLITYYKDLQTPHLVILMMNSINYLISTLTVDLSILYMSLFEHNPFRGNHWKCLSHRVFSQTPFLVNSHNLCLLSAERIAYFHCPYWHLRVVTTRKIMLTEFLIIVVALLYNTSSTATVETYFSVSNFLCSSVAAPWVWIVPMVIYYFLSSIFVAIAMIWLQVLICKKRRAIKCINSQTGRVTESQLQTTEDLQSVNDGIHSVVCMSIENRITTCTTDNPQNQTQSGTNVCISSSDQPGHSLKNIKTTIKLVASISGVFWLTFFPPVIALTLILQGASSFEQTFNIKLILLKRVFTFFSFLLTVIDPIIYIYVNPPLRSKAVNILRRLFSFNLFSFVGVNPQHLPQCKPFSWCKTGN